MLAGVTTAGAARQPDRALKQQLDSMSRQMRQGGNINFIVVQAVADSLLQTGGHYSFAWAHDSVSVNGRYVPQPYQSRYVAALNAFYLEQKHTSSKGYSYRIEGDSLRENELLNPKSSFWDVSQPQVMPDYNYVGREIVPQMQADGVLDTTKPYSLAYGYDGLRVNDATVPLELELKYRKMFKDLGDYEPTKPGDEYSLQGKPDAGEAKKNTARYAHVDDAFTQTLIDAGVADAKQPINIGIRPDVIIVNYKKLKKSLNKKMLARYKALNPDGPNTADITIYREGVQAPDIRTGNSVLHFGK